MGTGIAHVLALSGYDVVPTTSARMPWPRRSAGQRTCSLGGSDKEDPDRQPGAYPRRPDLDDLRDRDLVIEAATEDEAIKKKIFQDLCARISDKAMIATNTSSISVTRLAAATDRPENFIGLHFMNPVPVMQLVEVIRGIATNDTTFQAALEIVKRVGKTAAYAEDFPAFIVNRILLPMINEAVYTLYEGVGNVDAIDTAMRLGANHPMGRCNWPTLSARYLPQRDAGLYEGLADSKYRPCPLLVKYVKPAGWGRKTVAASTTIAANTRTDVSAAHPRNSLKYDRFRRTPVGGPAALATIFPADRSAPSSAGQSREAFIITFSLSR